MGVRNRKRCRWIFLGLVWLLLSNLYSPVGAAPEPQSVEDGAAIFQEKCAFCHTVGGGPLSGPDLMGVTAQRDREWLARWLAEPDKMLAEGDPIASRLLAEFNNVPMPNMGLTEAEVWALIDYMESESATGDPAQAEAAPTTGDPAQTEAAPATGEPAQTEAALALADGDPTQGEALFTGDARLQNGGPACMSCHGHAGIEGLGGGVLGPDLSQSFTKYGGAAGMAAVLADLPFPTMRPVYDGRSLTAEEQAHLRAFFQQADEVQGAPQSWPVAALAGAVFLVFMGVSQVVWRGRLQGVRRSLVKQKG